MEYMTTGKAARLCGVGINTIKRWIQKGELKCVVTPGGHWRIAEDEFQRFLDSLQFGTKAMDSNDDQYLPPQPEPAHKVLLIEDDQSLCTLIEGALLLAEDDMIVDCAYDGYSGLMKIGAMQPDLIVLDIMLPGINGLELMQRIRASNLCPDVRILVITGAADRRVVRRALQKATPDALFYKPFSIEQMVASAVDMLNEKPRVAQQS